MESVSSHSTNDKHYTIVKTLRQYALVGILAFFLFIFSLSYNNVYPRRYITA